MLKLSTHLQHHAVTKCDSSNESHADPGRVFISNATHMLSFPMSKSSYDLCHMQFAVAHGHNLKHGHARGHKDSCCYGCSSHPILGCTCGCNCSGKGWANRRNTVGSQSKKRTRTLQIVHTHIAVSNHPFLHTCTQAGPSHVFDAKTHVFDAKTQQTVPPLGLSKQPTRCRDVPHHTPQDAPHQTPPKQKAGT